MVRGNISEWKWFKDYWSFKFTNLGFKNYEALINNMNYTKDSDIIDDEFSVFNISKHKNNFNNNIKKSKKLKDGILTT